MSFRTASISSSHDSLSDRLGWKACCTPSLAGSLDDARTSSCPLGHFARRLFRAILTSCLIASDRMSVAPHLPTSIPGRLEDSRTSHASHVCTAPSKGSLDTLSGCLGGMSVAHSFSPSRSSSSFQTGIKRKGFWYICGTYSSFLLPLLRITSHLTISERLA